MEPVLRIFFGLLLLLHGLIHFLGAAKAFQPESIPQITRSIPKPEGVLWILAGLLLLGALASLIFQKNWWPALAIVGVIISQFVVSLSWEDAKFGTLANLIILAVSIPAYGQQRFSNMIQAEISALLAEVRLGEPVPNEIDFKSFPPVVNTWVRNSGATTQPQVQVVYLRQKGEMRTKPGGKWIPFEASQYIRVEDPGFVWFVKVAPYPLIHLTGRDRLQGGQGEMLIKLQSLFKVVDEAKNEKINSGTILRFLGEICWFPSAAGQPYLHWEELHETSARATIEIDGHSETGVFRFTPEGDFVSFEALRYYGGKGTAVKRPWIVETLEYKKFDGVKIPAVCRVTWQLPEEDFPWLRFEITHLEYNPDYPISGISHK